MEKTIREVSEAIEVSRFTLAQAAKKGLFKEAARQSGKTWLINTEHEDFQHWLEEHPKQARVKGLRKKILL